MKTTATASVILAAFAFAGAALAADDHWTYDSGTISDGDWTFNATVSGTSLTVNAVTAWPDTISSLDFSKPVRDNGTGNYTIVTLNPCFAKKKATATDDGYRPKDLEVTAAGLKLGELVLPQTGLTTISRAAFTHCSNLTHVVNYLPDSVTTIGNSAFAHCPAKQDLFLRGLNGGSGRGIFYHASIRSITFGPGFKTIGDTSNGMGSFQSCSSVTNIVFDPESSNINLPANAFDATLKLKQPLVLYGVTNVNSAAFSSCEVSSITFDKGIKTIGKLTKVTTLTNVCFLGNPPSLQSGTWADYGQGTDKTVTTYIYRRFNKTGEWNAYAEGGQIDMHNSTFSSEWATEPSKRPLLYIDKMAGYYISFK